jgi:adenylate cyclase
MATEAFKPAISDDAYRQVKGRLELKVNDLGLTQLKNIAEPIRVYALDVGHPAQPKPSSPAPTAPPEKSSPRRNICAVGFSWPALPAFISRSPG